MEFAGTQSSALASSEGNRSPSYDVPMDESRACSPRSCCCSICLMVSSQWRHAYPRSCSAGITEHSKANAKLKEGLEKLGVHYGEIPRNTGTGHSCGHCSFGCSHGEKQDGTATFLADAVQAGAKIITGDILYTCFTDCCVAIAA